MKLSIVTVIVISWYEVAIDFDFAMKSVFPAVANLYWIGKLCIFNLHLIVDCGKFVPEAATSIWTGERLSENHKKSFSIDIHCRQHVDEKVKTSKRGDLSFDCRDPPQRTAWTRQPTVAFSQVGNHPYKELFLTLAFWGGLIFIVDFWRWIFHLLPQALDVCCNNLCAEEQVEAFWPRKPRKPKTRKPQTRPHSGVPIINVPTN